ncbi:MAG: POTRA domain-containing protein [Schlesneria sp.]
MSLAIVSNIFSSGLADFSGSFCVRLTKSLAHFGWQGCVIAAVYYFAELGLRKKGANTRYIAGVIAMAFLAICPPVTFTLLSSVNSTNLTKFEDFHQPSSRQNQFASDEISSLLRPIPDRSDSKSVHPQFEPFLGRATIQRWTGAFLNNHLFERLSPYVMTVYLMVSSALLCRVLVGYSVGRKLKADSIDIVIDRLQQFVERLCEQWSMSVVPVVACCQQVAAPVVFGVLRPIILLPPCLVTGCTVDQLEALLAHELAHIRRWDLLVNLAQRVVEALLFFHPAVWYVSRRISIEREHACDDLVISTGWRPLDYCQALIRMAEACAVPRQSRVLVPISISAFGRGQSDFKQRILRLAGEPAANRPQMTRTGYSGLISVVAMLILMPFVLSSRTGSKPETPENFNSVVVAQPLVTGNEDREVCEVNPVAVVESGFVLKDPLVEVIIEGNSTIPDSEIAKHIKTRPGRPVTQKQIKDDVDALVRTRWFATVEPSLQKTNEGVVLAFHVLERPIVRRVEYKGLKKVKQKVFDAMTQLKPGSPFDVSSNRECARRIEEYYREIGFAFATVELEKGNDRNDREVVFSVNEGPKAYVSGVKYGVSIPFGPAMINVNNDGVSVPFGPAIGEVNKKLISKSQIVTLSVANSDPQQRANDTEQLKRYYHRLGYFDVDIQRDSTTPTGQSKAGSRYEIHQGIRYMIRHVEFLGNRIVPESEIRNFLKVTDNAFYNAVVIDRDLDAIKSVFDQKGHLLAHIEPLVRWTEERGLIDLVYRISPCIEAEGPVFMDDNEFRW